MIVMILEKVTTGLRGELNRWLIEPRSGVFVGHVSARVRERLWEKAIRQKRSGGVIQVWSTNTEQHFKIRMAGETSRNLVEIEGLQLVMIPGDFEKAKRLKSLK
jgi:CRISPR-associated protein Cas2